MSVCRVYSIKLSYRYTMIDVMRIDRVMIYMYDTYDDQTANLTVNSGIFTSRAMLRRLRIAPPGPQRP